MQRTSLQRTRLLGPVLFLAAVLLAVLLAVSVQPQPVEASVNPPVPPVQGGEPTNEMCLGCHSRPDQSVELASGEQLDISVDPDAFQSSVHGSEGLSCTQCHTNITTFPHPQIQAKSRKEYTLLFQQTCKNCHNDQFEANQDGIHAQALAGGNLNAPACSDCHDPHTQAKLTDDQGKLVPEAREWVALTCAKCHNAIFEQYKDSVHGAGIVAGNNPDVPTCTDCHGVHSIGDPTTAQFRLNSPQMCAECHTDETMMSKYGLSTNVLSTYVADFHGTTVTLFQKQHPDQETNKPVCYDCHGVHNIIKTDDPENGIAMKENMLVACQRCHPDATANFPDSWLSHYIPSPDRYPLVYYVNLFYTLFIPAVLGVMAIFVLSDIYRRVTRRGKASGGDQKPA